MGGEQEAVGITAAQIDVILYNLTAWRRLVATMEPRTSTSVVALPVPTARRPGSAVETIAIRRAEVSAVLDLVCGALRSMPRITRRVVSLRYHDGLSLREIAYRLNKPHRVKAAPGLNPPYSKSSVSRQLDRVRELLIQQLGSISPEFWTILGQRGC